MAKLLFMGDMLIANITTNHLGKPRKLESSKRILATIA